MPFLSDALRCTAKKAPPSVNFIKHFPKKYIRKTKFVDPSAVYDNRFGAPDKLVYEGDK